MRILQGKSSLTLGNNPNPREEVLPRFFKGKIKSQDNYHTSEMGMLFLKT